MFRQEYSLSPFSPTADTESSYQRYATLTLRPKRLFAKSIMCMLQNEDKQPFPGEDVVLFVVRQKKLPNDLSKAIRFEIGREKQENFL